MIKADRRLTTFNADVGTDSVFPKADLDSVALASVKL